MLMFGSHPTYLVHDGRLEGFLCLDSVHQHTVSTPLHLHSAVELTVEFVNRSKTTMNTRRLTQQGYRRRRVGDRVQGLRAGLGARAARQSASARAAVAMMNPTGASTQNNTNPLHKTYIRNIGYSRICIRL